MTFFAPSSPSFELLLRDSEHRRLPFHEVNVQDALPEQSRDATPSFFKSTRGGRGEV